MYQDHLILSVQIITYTCHQQNKRCLSPDKDSVYSKRGTTEIL